LLVILSGPEPQRTILENKIIKDIAHYPGNATVLRGLPGNATLVPSTNQIKFYNHLSAEELYKEMKKTGYVIARSGYSTIMDIAGVHKKSILIPTPGQTEQEYLAKYLQKKKFAFCINQDSFSLPVALQSAKSFDYTEATIEDKNTLQGVVSSFIRSLIKH
jgi:predicted glycosyltransferase